MAAITFRTTVSDEQVLRPPAGVVLPAGALEVTVKSVQENGRNTREAANLRLRQHRVSSGEAKGIENEAIDADLARVYGSGLKAP